MNDSLSKRIISAVISEAVESMGGDPNVEHDAPAIIKGEVDFIVDRVVPKVRNAFRLTSESTLSRQSNEALREVEHAVNSWYANASDRKMSSLVRYDPFRSGGVRMDRDAIGQAIRNFRDAYEELAAFGRKNGYIREDKRIMTMLRTFDLVQRYLMNELRWIDEYRGVNRRY